VTARDPAEELVAAFARWAAGERSAAAARGRTQERWLRQVATEAATFGGLLVDLAEGRAAVVLTVAGERHAGSVVGVAADFCVLTDQAGALQLVALRAVSSLRTGITRTGSEPAGDRPAAISLHLADALAALAADRAPVRLVLSDGGRALGDLVATSTDVVTLRVGSPSRQVVHVPLAAIASCQLR